MSVSAVAPTPFYQDPDRMQIGLPQPRAEEGKSSAASEGKHLSMFAEGDDEPSFWDMLDVVNPLQHIPIVNDIYRDLTGDKIGVGARLLGGTLLGGPIGLIAAAANCVIEESTGDDVGGHMLAWLKDEPATPDAAPAPATQLAAAPAAAEQPAAAAPAVPSSPAKAAAAEAAPVIALPDQPVQPAATRGGQTMVFTLDGAPAPTSAPAPAVDVAAAATAKPLPLGAQQARFLPTPNRATSANVAPPPAPVTVPVSNTGTRTTVPVTGRAPNAANAVGVQRAIAQQNVPAGHPMLPPTEAGGQTAASPDWFTQAWGQALDKYQRASQLNGKPAAATSTLE